MQRRAIALLAVLALAGCAAPGAPDASSTSNSSSSSSQPAVDCHAHRHATFAVFVPGPQGPQRLNMSAPKDAQGRPYYQLGIARNMSVAVHMHQAGAEQGSPDLAVSQMHYESPGACGTVATSLAAIDVHANAKGMTVAGKHPAGQWASNATDAVHLYTRQPDGCSWSERTLSALDEAVPDGLSFVVAFGAPDATLAAARQAMLPQPLGHAPSCAPA